MKALRPSRKRYFGIGIPDPHIGFIVDVPTHSHGCWDIGMQAIDYYGDRLTHIIIFGDFGNWESLSRWAALRASTVFIREDVELVKQKLGELDMRATKYGIQVVYLEGNHENWAAQLEAKYPFLRDQVNLKTQLRIKERGWIWVPENHFYALGELHFTHGHLRGIKKPSDFIRRKGVSIAYGHTHTYMTESMRTLTGEHAAWTVGCWASVDPPPPYARGDIPERWVHGFPLFQIRSNGRFQMSYRRIIDEAWTELEDGKELRARPREIQRRRDSEARLRERLRKKYSERFYVPGGEVTRPEPLRGTEYGTRAARGRIVTGKK
jgi:hypothetical protein